MHRLDLDDPDNGHHWNVDNWNDRYLHDSNHWRPGDIHYGSAANVHDSRAGHIDDRHDSNLDDRWAWGRAY